MAEGKKTRGKTAICYKTRDQVVVQPDGNGLGFGHARNRIEAGGDYQKTSPLTVYIYDIRCHHA